MLAQISLIAFACAFASLARKAFFTVVRQARSWAVSAVALEALTIDASAITLTTKINFEAFRGSLGAIFISSLLVFRSGRLERV